jgi:hypothetical protein
MKTNTSGLKSLDDVIAEDCWSYVTNTGQPMISRIRIGRPQPWPTNEHGDWICPLEIEHYTGGVRAIAGVGPVDALMNALSIVKGFASDIGKFMPVRNCSARLAQARRECSSGARQRGTIVTKVRLKLPMSKG